MKIDDKNEEKENKTKEEEKEKKEKIVKFSKMQIAFDFQDYLIEVFQHFQNGRLIDQQVYNELQEVLMRKKVDPYFEEDPNDDLKQFNIIINSSNNIEGHDHQSFFRNSLPHSPMTDSPFLICSESSIFQYYRDIFKDDIFYTKPVFDETLMTEPKPGPRDIQNDEDYPLFALFPTLSFFPMDPFHVFACDKKDLIYYVNRTLI